MNSHEARAVEIRALETLDEDFGTLGLRVGPRTGRTHNEKEWYVVRRFMYEAILAKNFEAPLLISKANPPAPDFRLEFSLTSATALIEITEATHPDDQREMTKFEESSAPVHMIGEMGGRFAG